MEISVNNNVWGNESITAYIGKPVKGSDLIYNVHFNWYLIKWTPTMQCGRANFIQNCLMNGKQVMDVRLLLFLGVYAYDFCQ